MKTPRRPTVNRMPIVAPFHQVKIDLSTDAASPQIVSVHHQIGWRDYRRTAFLRPAPGQAESADQDRYMLWMKRALVATSIAEPLRST
jgi:hypothetical protein